MVCVNLHAPAQCSLYEDPLKVRRDRGGWIDTHFAGCYRAAFNMPTDYKDTLNLPRTDFAMKADLASREPERLRKWENAGLYAAIQSARSQAPSFVLHDGPPFANGDVHIGTALNKILKDFILKYQTLCGKRAPYVPGWDCHGLPIEFKVSQEMRKASEAPGSTVEIRKACERYARQFIDLQRNQFRRLGVLGDWNNPYLTLDKDYEAQELSLFADIVEAGYVYRGKKPVYWSIPCRTALAEAEVEYQDHISQSVYVRFPVSGKPDTFIVIWTTTPWTLPANLAVAFNPALDYVRARVGSSHYIVHRGLLARVAEKCGWTVEDEAPVSAAELQALQYQHPFIPARTGRVLPAEFVTSDTGTGFVHIAPGHGLDDYNLGRAHGLPVYSPVNDDGALAHTPDFPVSHQMPVHLTGKSILEKKGMSEANTAVLDELKLQNALLCREDYHHSYPHCWRSKTPVIFRAMDQWFIRIDHDGFRERALREIESVRWVPDWGVNRIKGAVQSRPDWCISRQRCWGVPIPAFYDAQGQAILDPAIIRAVASLVGQHGSNLWFENSAEQLWRQVRPDNWAGPEAVAKSNDTLDVWIDSGSSSRAVISRRAELRGSQAPFQADVYLEGSDQHRGWFQSSLLLSLAGNGAAPFKTVLTHGFMVDADREKISKSKQGAYEKPQTAEAYVKKYGADVVRLWVASQDYRNDIVVSEERINKVGETYRAIRNALRYQLSNLYDFNPELHALPPSQWTGLDRWMMAQFIRLDSEVRAAFGQFDFHVVYQKISQFVSVELSSVYHDVIKDRLYTDPAHSIRRRATQTVLDAMAGGLCKLLAPILAFTADEAWEMLPGKPRGSVHEQTFSSRTFSMAREEEESWRQFFELRESVLLKLEDARKQKTIGKSLDAKVELLVKSQFSKACEHEEDLRELFNVSQLKVKNVGGLGDGFGDGPGDGFGDGFGDGRSQSFKFQIVHAEGRKCERCWHWETDIGAHAAHPTLCGRCNLAVESTQPLSS